MPATRGTIFLNPSAGSRLPEREQITFREALTAAGLECIEVAQGLDIPAAIRERIQMGTRLFIGAGGDGTINHVAQAVVGSEATLGVIPAGTYNHFARDLGIPLDWRSALDVALTGARRQIDVARINDRYFLNNVSIGLYPELVARREERGRDYPRWKAKMYAAFVTLRKYPHVSFTLESEHHCEVIRTQVFMISNNSYDLSRIGVESPRNALTEGRLGVYWLPRISRLELMKFAGHYLAGRARSAPGFRSFRAARLKVQSARPALHLGIDGEVVTMPSPLVVTTVPQSLTVRVAR